MIAKQAMSGNNGSFARRRRQRRNRLIAAFDEHA
jgi:hypothetical protein